MLKEEILSVHRDKGNLWGVILRTGKRDSVGKHMNYETGRFENFPVTEPYVQFTLICEDGMKPLPPYYAETIANSVEGTGLCLHGGFPWANISATAMDKFRYDIRKALIKYGREQYRKDNQ